MVECMEYLSVSDGSHLLPVQHLAVGRMLQFLVDVVVARRVLCPSRVIPNEHQGAALFAIMRKRVFINFRLV